MTEYQTENSEAYTREDSLTSLRTLPKNKSDSSTRSAVSQGQESSVSEMMKEVEAYKEKLSIIPELESKILILEQNEQNLKRQKQNLQMEVSELKIQIEKMKMGEEGGSEEKSNSKVNDTMKNLTLKEAKEIIQELLNEVEEMKKEKNEISERALNMLTEKELANMELREQLEELRNSQYMEINNLAREMYFREDLDSSHSLTTKNSSNDFNSVRKSMLHIPSSTSLHDTPGKDSTKDISSNLKDMLFSLETEKESILKMYEEERANFQHKVSQLEETILKLQTDLANQELESANIISSKNQDEMNKNEIFSEIETLHNTIRFLEEKNAKSEFNHKEYLQKLKEEMAELDKINKNLRIANEKLEKEVLSLKNEYQAKLKNLVDKHKSDFSQKEKEVRTLQLKNEELAREKVYVANELDTLKKNQEINKENYQKLQINLQNIKESYEKEKKVYEDKLAAGEKRFESEKNNLVEQLTVLQTKFNQIVTSSNTQRKTSEMFRGKKTSGFSIPNFHLLMNDDQTTDVSYTDRSGYNTIHHRMSYSQNNISSSVTNIHTNQPLPTLSDCLEDTNNEDSPEAVIIDLENRIEAYESQINELNLKINQFSKKEKEIEILKFENTNMKENLERMKNIYEEQIKDLQKKNLLMNAELQSKRKVSDIKSNKEGNKSIDNIDIQKIGDNLVTINNLTLEVENLKSLLAKERKAHNSHLKECEEKTSSIKIQIAQLSFDHESQTVKLKNEIKKLKKEIEKYNMIKPIKR